MLKMSNASRSNHDTVLRVAHRQHVTPTIQEAATISAEVTFNSTTVAARRTAGITTAVARVAAV
jgi:hypothetical protein